VCSFHIMLKHIEHNYPSRLGGQRKCQMTVDTKQDSNQEPPAIETRDFGDETICCDLKVFVCVRNILRYGRMYIIM
jgi:hypothetical protein